MVYKGIIQSVFNKVKLSAAIRDIPFNVSLQYVGDLFEKQKGYCALTGQKLTLKKTLKDTTATASLDRKDSSKGYIQGNLQWVHKDVNRMKNNLKEETFVDLCKKVALHQIKLP